MAAERSYPCLRPGEAARRSDPMSRERWLVGAGGPMFKVGRGVGEEIPFDQGKEQRLCFARAAVKRYPTSKVRETRVRP